LTPIPTNGNTKALVFSINTLVETTKKLLVFSEWLNTWWAWAAPAKPSGGWL